MPKREKETRTTEKCLTYLIQLISLFFLYQLAKLKLAIIKGPQITIVTADNLNEIGITKNEKKVAKLLFKILNPHGITLIYESTTIRNPGIKRKQNTTKPDFYLEMYGIHIFIEVGGYKHSGKKKRQKKVVEINLNDKDELIIYVQIYARDLEELAKVTDPETLLEFLKKRKHIVTNMN